MIHKCEYCGDGIEPCAKPCLERNSKDHVCCTCPADNCELPVRIVCSKPLCNLKHNVSYYETKLEELKGATEAQDERLTDLTKLVNQWRLCNLGTSNIADVISSGKLSLGNVKLFVTQQMLTWDRFPVDIAYTIMCLHEEFSKQAANWLNQKAVKVTIRKDLLDQTNKKLKDSENIRKGIANGDGSKKPEKTIKATLTKPEKIILDRMKTFGWNQSQAEESLTAMGMILEPKPRNLKELGLI